jgi:transposase
VAQWRPKTPAHVQRIQQARRSGREARYQQVVELNKQGMTAKEIASRLRLSVRTVQRWLAAGSFQYKSSRRKRQTSFDAFAPYVLRRWKEGERNGLAIFREIKEHGYTGSDRSLYRYLQTLKQAEVQIAVSPERIQKFSASSALWLFVREKDTLDDLEQEDLRAWLMASPTLAKAYQLIQDFLVMMHKREGHRLETWLQKVEVSSIPELQSFAAGVERDKAAVQAGLTQSTNNDYVAYCTS